MKQYKDEALVVGMLAIIAITLAVFALAYIQTTCETTVLERAGIEILRLAGELEFSERFMLNVCEIIG